MMALGECLTDNSEILLVGSDYEKRIEKGKSRRIYRKSFNHAEIIGEKLCSIRNLRCPHFFLVSDGREKSTRRVTYKLIKNKSYDIKLGSYDFCRDGCFYFNIDNISSGDDKLNSLLNMIHKDDNRRELADEICELFALDVYMGQVDRFGDNILFEFDLNSGSIHLAPIFDFQHSLKSGYTDSKCVYNNQIHCFKTLDDFYEFISKYPRFRSMLSSYLDVSLVDYVKSGYKDAGLSVPDEKIKFYSEFEEDRKELIKRIIK